ncbi:MAG TPA: hypothetical protein VLX92_17245 [Kofleriaceae bacterium]|nr:hypothetical protein [Kofleriaceae bacterium]
MLRQIACLGVVAACSTSAPGVVRTYDACAPLRLDAAGASDGELAAIDRASASWSAVGIAAPSRSAPAAADDVAISFVPGAPASYGYYDGATGAIEINQELAGDALADTIAHELGHAFGLVHVAPGVRASVMNPGNLTVAPTVDDAAAVAAIWGSCAR